MDSIAQGDAFHGASSLCGDQRRGLEVRVMTRDDAMTRDDTESAFPLLRFFHARGNSKSVSPVHPSFVSRTECEANRS